MPQPVQYAYNAYGERTSMLTFRADPADNAEWTDTTWPGSPSIAGDETQWHFDAATGLLLSKEYADSTETTYTYTADGKLETRTWAREVASSPLVTTYIYDVPNELAEGPTGTGDLLNILYSDATPDITYTYSQSGLLASVTDASGTRDFTYTATLQSETETLDSGFFEDDRVITRSYSDSAPYGRATGLEIGTGPEYETGYGYDASGRLNRITGPGLPAYGVVYSFLADSDMVEKLEYRLDISTNLFRTTRAFEAERNLLTSVENKWIGDSSNAIVSKYAYTNDDLSRRDSIVRTGAAFAGDHLDLLTYNARNELLTSTRYDDTDVVTPENPDPNFNLSYAYDAIGNRRDKDPDTWAPGAQVTQYDDIAEDYLTVDRYYDTNELNQYDRIQQLVSLTSHDAYAQDLQYDADGNLILAKSYGDANCDDVVNEEDIDAFILAVVDPEEWEIEFPGCDILNCDMNGDAAVNNYDLDPFSNALGATTVAPVVLFNFEWDAENRLKAVWPATPLVISNSKKYVYTYDYLGRRIAIQRFLCTDDDPVAWASTPDYDRRFIYDGWNVMMTLDAATSGFPATRKYTWGLDLAGLSGGTGFQPVSGLHSAGGIGGLLAVNVETADPDTAENGGFWFTYDANGNVGQLVAGANAYGGASDDEWHADRLAARYEYDPYGNPANAINSFAATNRFRFSTKYSDSETNLYYYGHRYYSPKLGRWINRDPAGERGGANFYSTNYNDCIDRVDPDGRVPVPCDWAGFGCPQTCARGNWGYTICIAPPTFPGMPLLPGTLCACICDTKFNQELRDPTGRGIARDCTVIHEDFHATSGRNTCPPMGFPVPGPYWRDPTVARGDDDEARAGSEGLTCVRRRLGECRNAANQTQCYCDLLHWVDTQSCVALAGGRPGEERACARTKELLIAGLRSKCPAPAAAPANVPNSGSEAPGGGEDVGP